MNLSVILQTGLYPDNLLWFKVPPPVPAPVPGGPGKLRPVHGHPHDRHHHVEQQPRLPQVTDTLV